MNRPMPKFDGPIPGENYTEDVRNFPWHRPPENPDYVSTVEDALNRVARPQATGFIEAALSSGESVLDVVTGLMRIGVGKGYYSIDNAILAAGPVAKMVEVIADDLGLDYRKEYDEDPRILNKEFVRGVSPPEPEEEGGSADEEPEMTTAEDAASGGLMSMSPDDPADVDVQSQMLGYSEEERA